jgi:hypothetical protein
VRIKEQKKYKVKGTKIKMNVRGRGKIEGR